MRTATLAALIGGVALAAAATACGPNATNNGDGGGGTVDGSNTIDAYIPPLADAYQQERNCSGDLQYVLDENGNILETCWPDEGCYEGQCIAPCTAAANSQGNVGCDFTVSTPHFYVGIAPPCFAVFVANNWPLPAHLTVSRGGQSYDVTQFGRVATSDPNVATWPAVPASGLAEGEVAVVFLSHDPVSSNVTPLTCPIAPAISATGGSAVAGTGRGTAWSITSDVPVSMYDILPFGGALSYLPSAELVLPTSAWGDEYITVMPKPSTNNNGGPPWAHIVAHEDNTIIDIQPTIALPAGTNVVSAPANTVTQFTLNAGEYIQWQFGSETQDMSGSVISSDKPVSFVGGNAYICYSSATSNGGGCDSAHQQIPPLNALGSEYIAAPFPTRGTGPESLPYRIVGTVDGTTLAYDPTVPGAPTTINQGQVIDFESTAAFAVTSQDEDHPFYVGQMMSGCLLTSGNPNCDGDEEYVNVLPPAQFLEKYVFFTDPSYPITNLVFVRKTENGVGSAVNLACLGDLTGWTQVGTSEYETTTVPLLNSCTNGPHAASSDAPFGITVWGLDHASSYAYPAGGNVSDINAVDIIIE